jgi:hypothetical protein
MEMIPVRTSPERVRYRNSSLVTRLSCPSWSRSSRRLSSSGQEPISLVVWPITSRPYPLALRKASLTSTKRPSGKVASVRGMGLERKALTNFSSERRIAASARWLSA